MALDSRFTRKEVDERYYISRKRQIRVKQLKNKEYNTVRSGGGSIDRTQDL